MADERRKVSGAADPWNVGGVGVGWPDVLALDADVALLQEGPTPHHETAGRDLPHPDDGEWMPAGPETRPWRTAVVVLSQMRSIWGRLPARRWAPVAPRNCVRGHHDLVRTYSRHARVSKDRAGRHDSFAHPRSSELRHQDRRMEPFHGVHSCWDPGVRTPALPATDDCPTSSGTGREPVR